MATLIPLSRWVEYPADHRVAVNLGKPILKRELESRVAGWVAVLRRRSGSRWAVYHGDSCEFLAILLALWQLGRTACIPSDNRPATVERLTRHLDGLVGEFGPQFEALAADPDADGVDLDPDALEPGLAAMEIYTSGSTGDPRAIVKTIEQLEREIESIENLWPGANDNVVLATVSHQHFYGMTFGLLWPFSSGRAFESRFCELVEDIPFKAGHYERFALVSSPSHLSRFGSGIDWAAIAGRCDYVVSSAAPLARADSIHVSGLLQAPVREIYGSSETGAIAWRIQAGSEPDAAWRALPGVIFEPMEDLGARIRSPYQGAAGFELQDRLQFEDGGGFRLLGRTDSIVKVEGKRVSLAAIERRLAGHDWLRQARALVIERARVESAVVAQLTDAGRQALQALGRKRFIDDLRALLLQEFEAVVVPRRWRFVDAMPYNRQGKLPLESLRALFAREGVVRPQILRHEIGQRELSLQCLIPRDLVYFDGHMPDNPVLPGIVQLHWAQLYGRELLSVSGDFERLEAVKFQQVIRPHYEVEMNLVYHADAGKLKFRFESARGVHSSGRICYAD